MVLGEIGNTPDHPAVVEVGELLLPPRQTFEIRILRPDGRPAAGIEAVRSDGRRIDASVAAADESGLLRLPTVAAPDELRLRLGDWLYGHALYEGWWSDPFVLPEIPEAEFEVIDRENQPAVGLEGYFCFDNFEAPADLFGFFRVGADGRVRLPDFGSLVAAGAERPASVDIRVRWGPELPWMKFGVEVSLSQRWIQVPRPRSRIVQVVGPDGSPVEGAALGWVYDRSGPRSFPPDYLFIAALGEALGDGSYRIDGIQSNTVRLVAEAPGFGRGWLLPEQEGPLRLPEERLVDFVAIGPDGAPAADAWIKLHCFGGDLDSCWSQPCTSLLDRDSGRTDERGRLRLEACADHGGGSASIRHQGRRWSGRWMPGQGEAVVAMPGYGSVSGEVIPAADEDLRVGEIRVAPAKNSPLRFPVRTTRPEADGSFRVGEVPAGAIEVSYLVAGAGPADAPWIQGSVSVQTEVDEGEDTPVVLSRRGLGQLALVLLRGAARRHGEPATGALDLWFPGLSPIQRQMLWGFQVELTVGGSFAALVPPGRVELRQHDPSGETWQPTTTLEVAADCVAPIPVDLDGRLLEFTARSRSGEPLTGIWLILISNDEEYWGSGRTDEQGFLRLETPWELPGDLTLHATRYWRRPPQEPKVEIPLAEEDFGPGDRLTLTLDLD